MKMFNEISVLSSFLLMIAYCDYQQHLPCSFNPLCTCSKPGPTLGWVQCHKVTLINLPHELYNKTVYIVSLKHNKLRFLDEEKSFIPGIWRLEVQHNFLTKIPSKIFLNVEKSLRELDFSHNRLNAIPNNALKHLSRIEKLDLSYNHIYNIDTDDLNGLYKSLKILKLAGNSLTSIQLNSFNEFASLHTLDLSHNIMNNIDGKLFENKSNQLKYINLSNNQLQSIPFSVLSNLKQLQVLNLMHNRISAISDPQFQGHLSLDELHLEHNELKSLPPYSFKNFQFINKTFLAANPIKSVDDDAFSNINLKELYLENCEINMICAKSFHSLERSIEILDLSSNNITSFPMAAIKHLKKLKIFNIAENRIPALEDSFKEVQGDFQSINLSGRYMGYISFQAFAGIHNLKQLSIKGLAENRLEKDLFKGFAHGFERLSLRNNEISEIYDSAFHYLPGLRHLDLSYNKITKLHPLAFKDIGYSLEMLDLHHGLISTELAPFAFQHLVNVQSLDLSGNRLQLLPVEMFSWMRSIRYVTLSHNLITELGSNHFQHTNNPDITWIKFSFNKLKGLKKHTFHNLHKLINLELNDNSIEFIEKSAFLDLPSVLNIQLQGNKIRILETESFQNLPKLKILNLSYNELKILNLDVFDQVSMLSALKIDIRQNSIQKLGENDTNWQPVCAIQSLDFTGNNISYISPQYFYPVRNSLTHLTLSFNNFFNITDNVFSDLNHLLKLEIHNNKMNALEEESFVELKGLLILNISHNKLVDIPADIFRENHNLEILDVSFNILRGLPADVFKGTKLKVLQISNNKMIHFPDDAILSVNNSLKSLDLSFNNIRIISHSQVKYLNELVELNLSHNYLRQIEESSLAAFKKLLVLDLSHNLFQKPTVKGLDLLPTSIKELNLANTNLTKIPSFSLPHLLELNFSTNLLTSLSEEMFANLSNIQLLDVSGNFLQEFGSDTWNVLPNLRSLYLSDNPVLNLSKENFASLNRLEELHIVNLPLQHIEKDVFHSLSAMQILTMDAYPQIPSYNIGQLVKETCVLSHINLHITGNNFGNEILMRLPKTLRKLTVQGSQLETIHPSVLDSMESTNLYLHIHHTNISKLPETFFANLGKVNHLILDVRDNNLETIADVKTAQSSTKIHQFQLDGILLSGNPWQCDCKLAWIKEWIKEKQYNQQIQAISDNAFINNLRETECINIYNRSIIEVLKNDLNCYIYSHSSSALKNEFSLGSILVFWNMVFLNIFTPIWYVDIM